MPVDAVRVEGLRDLQRAFKLADKTLSLELRSTLREVAKPVQYDAERLAVDTIPRIGLPWSRMRIGVAQTSVYVAPKQRGVKTRGRDPRRRPNLFDLLLGRALEPALEQNQQQIVAGIEHMLGTVGRAWERV